MYSTIDINKKLISHNNPGGITSMLVIGHNKEHDPRSGFINSSISGINISFGPLGLRSPVFRLCSPDYTKERFLTAF